MDKTICKCGKRKDKRAVQCRACRDQEPSEKLCRGCGTVYLIEEYSLRPNGRGGHKRRSRCKICEASTARIGRANRTPEERAITKQKKQQYNKEHADDVRRWGLRSQWKQRGFNPDEVEQFIAAQPKQCRICGTTDKLVLDHNHANNQLRGLLCSCCNAGLGQFKDNPVLLTQAIVYLHNSA